MVNSTSKSIDLSGYFKDEDGDTLTYTLSNFPGITVLNGSREPVVSILSSRLTAKANEEATGKK